MSYVKATNFAVKDGLPSGNPSKIIKGTEIDTEFSAIQTESTSVTAALATKQPLDATLTSLSALGTAADKLAYTTAADTWAETPFTAAARTVLDDTTVAAMRSTLGAAASGANTDITSLSAPALGSATATTQITTDDSTKVATTAFVQTKSAFTRSVIQPLTVVAAAAGALDITLGVTSLDFRSTTLTNGTPVTRLVTTPLTVTIPTSASLGGTSAVADTLVVVAIDYLGTVELAVINSTATVDLSEKGVITTVAISGTATNANTFYSTTARTNVAYRIVGFVNALFIAPNWVSFSLVQGYGGEALPRILVTDTSVAMSSTSVEWTNIPSYIKRITIALQGISTNGTSDIILQIGYSGSWQTASYISHTGTIVAAAASSADFTNGFALTTGWAAAYALYGTVRMEQRQTRFHVDGICRRDAVGISLLSGYHQNTGPIDMLRITTANGTDTFDAGNIRMMWE